jgi:SAM-dependent methyltransferase
VASAIAEKWNFFDRLLQNVRYRRAAELIPNGSVVLDFGCGDGGFLKFLAPRISYGFGIDPFAAPGVKDGYSIVHQSARQSFPVADNSIDVVSALAVVEHLDDPRWFFSEAHRALRENGSLIFTTPAPCSKPILEFLAFNLHVISEADIRDHKSYYGPPAIHRLLDLYSAISYSTFQLGLNQLVIARK